ncbi:MAG: YfhO family protein [Planctomycetaceae bacterium]|nr:YfhO family protein [Planctomycetaceae bacterium]
MTWRRERWAFAAALAALVAGFLGESLFAGRVLSPADVLRVSASFRDERGPSFEPANRLLMDPVLQFQPWLDFNRAMLRRGRLPLWNGLAGCGAPHLANGQSAVFDPFHAIAYLGTLPEAYVWMAAARLWVAGMGMFLLARSWGLGPWGRWFAGLAFPFCGFLIVWLLYPVTSVAVWMPWLFLATDRALAGPGPRTVGLLALVVGLVLLGGHAQTSAHVLLAAGLHAAWRASGRGLARGGLAAWAGGVALGVALAAVEVVPLWCYLGRSPVWADRAQARPSPWALTRPRVLESVCTALPYAFGSQRRGHPNLARALGVENLNESAGGFAGLATLIWLAPLGWCERSRRPWARSLAGLVVVGALGAFGLPPVANVLRAVPVLDVTDNRRLTLWVAFGLILLGGLGIDRLAAARPRRVGARLWVVAAAGALAVSAGVGRAEPRLRARAQEHYARIAAEVPGADPAVSRDRAERQVRSALEFVPRYLAVAAGHFVLLAVLAESWWRGRISGRAIRPMLMGLTLVDLFGFGLGLNPAIDPGDDHPEGAVVAYLRREVGPDGRVLGVGEELPPNTLMRFGLGDVRNYDSVELSRNLDWFAPLYEPDGAPRSSRRAITWAGVLRARDRLREASVRAVVASAPPPGAFARVDRVGAVWVARLDAAPWASAASRPARLDVRRDHDRARIAVLCPGDDRIIIRETFDPGWRAEVDGRAVPVEPAHGVFLSVPVTAGTHVINLRYEPPEVRAAVAITALALAFLVFSLTGFRRFRSTRIIVPGLGRTQPAELESVLCTSPANH